MKGTGVHIISTFKGVDFDAVKNINEHDLINHYLGMISSYGLEVLGHNFHLFDRHAYTMTVLLAESHFCIHTRPELGIINFDVYVCNHMNDNSSIPLMIFNQLKEEFCPTESNKMIIER